MRESIGDCCTCLLELGTVLVEDEAGVCQQEVRVELEGELGWIFTCVKCSCRLRFADAVHHGANWQRALQFNAQSAAESRVVGDPVAVCPLEAVPGNAASPRVAIARSLASDEGFIGPAVLTLQVNKKANRNRSGRPPRGGRGALTQRELQVLRLVRSGYTNREIAAELILSHKPVARHLERRGRRMISPE